MEESKIVSVKPIEAIHHPLFACGRDMVTPLAGQQDSLRILVTEFLAKVL
jgi:hypothetical protein